jgi:putative ABC transport system substrate-binding protein
VNLRRKLLMTIGAAPLVAFARLCFAQQRAKVWRIGFFENVPGQDRFDAFRDAMRDLGYVEGKNIRYDRRFSQGENEPLANLAAELVRLNVDLIVAFGTPTTRAAQRATTAIPIVTVFAGDPVGSGLVASLGRPGANVTGIANLNVEINAKRVDLLVTTLPNISRVAALLNPTNPTYAANLAALQSASRKAKVTLLPSTASTLTEIEGAFPLMRQQNAEALIVQTDSIFLANARQVAEHAARLRLPVIGTRALVDFGALMSYEPNMRASFVRAATYVDKILKGANPADMPVEQPTKLDLTVNLRAARSLGISIPREILLLADEVIQ